MKVFALVCAVMALTLAAALSEEKTQNKSDQKAESHLSRGGCLQYVATPMTWAKAEKNCLAMGGNLASVHNILEYSEIQRVILLATGQNLRAWIGGTDAQEDNQWFWSDGTPFHYNHWCPREPNNAGGKQHCLKINDKDQNCWDDCECDTKLPSVCAKRT